MQNRLSVIVPAFNEERSLAACLNALLAQGDQIHEIIVVDNASTDGTRAVAEALAHRNAKLSILTEPKRGIVSARNAGFNAASGSLIARVDADTVVENEWVNSIHTFFERTDHRFAGGTGMSFFNDLPFQTPFQRIQQKTNKSLNTKLASGDTVSTPEIIGLNMVVTKDAWIAVRDSLSERTDVHEDVDLSICLRASGARLAIIPGMTVSTSGRRFLASPSTFLRHYWAGPRTYIARGAKRSAATVAVTSSPAIVFYLLMWVPFRMWDPTKHRFDVTRLVRAAEINTRVEIR